MYLYPFALVRPNPQQCIWRYDFFTLDSVCNSLPVRLTHCFQNCMPLIQNLLKLLLQGVFVNVAYQPKAVTVLTDKNPSISQYPIGPLIKSWAKTWPLHGYDVSMSVVPDKEMHVVGSHRITEHAETVALFGFKYPLEIAAAISGEFQKEFLFMTPMSNMPDMAWYIMSVRPWHCICPFLECSFTR